VSQYQKSLKNSGSTPEEPTDSRILIENSITSPISGLGDKTDFLLVEENLATNAATDNLKSLMKSTPVQELGDDSEEILRNRGEKMFEMIRNLESKEVDLPNSPLKKNQKYSSKKPKIPNRYYSKLRSHTPTNTKQKI